MFRKWRFKDDKAGKMRISDQNLVKHTSGTTTFLYDVETETILKPEGFLDGITKEQAAPIRHYIIPLSGGSVDK